MTKSAFSRFPLNRFFKVLSLLVAAECFIANSFTGPSAALAAPPSLAAEYEEWGLEPPTNSNKSDGRAEQGNPLPKPQTQPTTQNPQVPAALAEPFAQASVLILIVMDDDTELVTLGWIVDKERGIVMTHGHLLDKAKLIFVGYPQLPREGKEGTMTGSPAVLMQYQTKMDIAYLQVENPIPASLPALHVAVDRPAPVAAEKSYEHQSQKPVPVANPLVGNWFLNDTINGYQVAIQVRFDANGQFQMSMTSIDAAGNREQEAWVGNYKIQGNKLLMQTNEGPQQAEFVFEKGFLCVTLASNNVTFWFQRA